MTSTPFTERRNALTMSIDTDTSEGDREKKRCEKFKLNNEMIL